MDWDLLPGAQLPKPGSIEKLLPGYTALYDPALVGNRDRYVATLKDRFHQRRVFLQNSDLHNRPELLMRLVNALMVRA